VPYRDPLAALRARRRALALEAAELDDRIEQLEARRLPLLERARSTADCRAGMRRRRSRLVATTLAFGTAVAMVAPALFEPPLAGIGLMDERPGTPSERGGEGVWRLEYGHEDCGEADLSAGSRTRILPGTAEIGFAYAVCLDRAAAAGSSRAANNYRHRSRR